MGGRFRFSCSVASWRATTRTHVNARRLADVADVTAGQYQPRGTTPLYDALGWTFNHLADRAARRTDGELPAEAVELVTITDGLENASRRWDDRAIAGRIRRRKSAGWRFRYLGANQDACAEGARMGLDRGDVAGFVADAGVTHIIDCRMEWSDEEVVAAHAPGVAYLHHGVDDAGQRMPDWWFDEGVAFALDALARPGTKVFAHCHMGINRGPSMAYAILLAQDIDPIDALDAIRAARSIAAVGYAEDALDWHHRRTGAGEFQRASDRRRLRAWRAADTLDVASVIRGIRAAEGTDLR